MLAGSKGQRGMGRGRTEVGRGPVGPQSIASRAGERCEGVGGSWRKGDRLYVAEEEGNGKGKEMGVVPGRA